VDLSKILHTRGFILILYLLAVNVYGMAVMGIDKWKSSRRKWRVPERKLFLIAAVGGAAGIFAGMKLFHHKTLHNKFRYGIPVILAIEAVVVFYIFYAL
jgi:uncharacterized membrane protein YsdA (DUF1294 family)